MRSPSPVLSAPLVVWGRAALAHRAPHGCEPSLSTSFALRSWGWQIWLWGLLFSPCGFLFLSVVLEAPVVLHAGGRAGHGTPKMGTWSCWLHPGNLPPWGTGKAGDEEEETRGVWMHAGVQSWPVGCSWGAVLAHGMLSGH